MTSARHAIVPQRAAVSVFYDGACPLCRREIAHYRRLRSAEPIRWVDIGRDPAELEADGLTRDQAMQRLHVRDAKGAWHTGAWAFAELWSHLPGYRWLAAALRHSRTLPLADRGYARFARWRVRRRRGTDACGLPAASRPMPGNAGEPPSPGSPAKDKDPCR